MLAAAEVMLRRSCSKAALEEALPVRLTDMDRNQKARVVESSLLALSQRETCPSKLAATFMILSPVSVVAAESAALPTSRVMPPVLLTRASVMRMALTACEAVKVPARAARASAIVVAGASVSIPVHAKSRSMTLKSCSTVVLKRPLAIDTSVGRNNRVTNAHVSIDTRDAYPIKNVFGLSGEWTSSRALTSGDQKRAVKGRPVDAGGIDDIAVCLICERGPLAWAGCRHID